MTALQCTQSSYHSPAAVRGSSVGWGTAAGSTSAAALSPAGTQSAADCTESFLKEEGGTVSSLGTGQANSYGTLAPCLQR